jgi:hypothetical protein
MAETSEHMKRPRILDDLTKKRALEIFWPKLLVYEGSEYREANRASTERHILAVLSGSRDGYAMARDLENNYGWAEDRNLVDLMDDAASAMTAAHKELVGQWVKAYNITADRKVGDEVRTNIRPRGNVAGTIVKLYEDEAHYGVRYPDQPETSHYILDYEEVKDLAVAIVLG